MLFIEVFYAVLLLPLLGPAVAVSALVVFDRPRRPVASIALALLLLVPVFVLAQALLSLATWCLSPLAAATARPPYAPWYAELLLAPACYVCLQALHQAWVRHAVRWRQLLPGLGQLGLFAGVAVLNLGYRHGVAAASLGPPSAAAELLRHLLSPLALGCYVLLALYGLQAYDAYRRYALAHTPAGQRPRSGVPRALLLLVLLGFGLELSFVALDAWFGPFAYSEVWYMFGVRAGLIFGLTVVALQVGFGGGQPLPLTQAAGEAALVPAGWPPAIVAAPSRPATVSPTVLPVELHPWRDKLLALMESERPWLQPELSLGELAQRLRTHPAQLSKIINQGCGQSFSDFINGYRVQEARRKLADPRFAHYSLVGVALECGFNSKSTFNRVFKKLTGQAPGELTRPKA